jgi:hypothetical protein
MIEASIAFSYGRPRIAKGDAGYLLINTQSTL